MYLVATIKSFAAGTGEEKRGDKLGSAESSGKKGNKGAGNSEGDDVYETEITLEELMDYIVEDLDLPNLDKKKYSEIISESASRKRGYQKHGINNPEKKEKDCYGKRPHEWQGKIRALKEAGLDTELERFPFREDDIRYYRVKTKPRKESNAVMLFIMDVSGSMDSTKVFSKIIFFVLSTFIKRKYNNIAFELISHTTVAKEVNEYEFFHKAESGGTYISSGLNLALKLIEEKYSPEVWNIYPIYASDGDNWSEDNEKAIQSVKKLCEVSNMFGYAELYHQLIQQQCIIDSIRK